LDGILAEENKKISIIQTNFSEIYVHKTKFSISSTAVLFGNDLVTFWTTHDLGNFSFFNPFCVELLLVDDDDDFVVLLPQAADKLYSDSVIKEVDATEFS
jgi:hypothetical protein